MKMRRRSDFTVAVVDAVSAVLCCYIAYRLRFEGRLPLPAHFAHRYEIATAATGVLWPLLTRAAGLYRRGALRLGTSNLEPAFESAVGAAVLLGATDLVVRDLSRAWLALVVGFLFVAALVTRAGLRRGRRALVPFGLALERYAVMGSAPQRRRLIGDLTRAPGAPFRIIAELPPDLGPDELVLEVQRLRLDGVIAPPGVLPDAGSVSGRLATLGADVLIAPSIADLDLRVASIVMLHGVPLLRTAGLSPRRPAVRTEASADHSRCGHHRHPGDPRQLRRVRDLRRAAGAVPRRCGGAGDGLLPPPSRDGRQGVAGGSARHVADDPQQVPRHGGAHRPVRRPPDHPTRIRARGALQRGQRAGPAVAPAVRQAGGHERRRSGVAPRQVGCRRPVVVPAGGVAVGALGAVSSSPTPTRSVPTTGSGTTPTP